MTEPHLLKNIANVVNLMRDAVFQEITKHIKNRNIILTFLLGSRDEAIFQNVKSNIHDIYILGLTKESCAVLSQKLEHKAPENLSRSVSHCAQGDTAQLSVKDSMKDALFGEIVSSVLKGECTLIVAMGTVAEESIRWLVESLQTVRVLNLAADACKILFHEGELKTLGTHLSKESEPMKALSFVEQRSEKGSTSKHICADCGKSFSRRSGLLTHEKAFHWNMTPHQCKYCDKAFVYPKELRVHSMIHTGERPFKCESCTKGFFTKKDLLRHYPVHTGVKSFVCTTCTARFAHKSNLDRHVRSKHEGRRPYVCSLCVNKRYCDRGGLRKHLAAAHQIYDVPKTKEHNLVIIPMQNANHENKMTLENQKLMKVSTGDLGSKPVYQNDSCNTETDTGPVHSIPSGNVESSVNSISHLLIVKENHSFQTYINIDQSIKDHIDDSGSKTNVSEEKTQQGEMSKVDDGS